MTAPARVLSPQPIPAAPVRAAGAAGALRDLLRQRFPDAAPLAHGSARCVATGLAPLDHILPGGGLPRGKLTAWAPQGGAMAILRAACQTVTAGGERTVWIDAARTVGPDWDDGPLLVRPDTPRAALRAAELLLRSGGIALLVLTGAEPAGTAAVRLTRAAREGGGAFVALTHAEAMAPLRLTSRLLPDRYRWLPGPFAEPAGACEATIEVRARALGWSARAEVAMPIAPYDLRLSLDPELVDRRGAER